MDPLERTLKYAEAHLNKADLLLVEADKLRLELRENAEEAESNYKTAIMRGEMYVPVDFMRADNEFNGAKLKLEEKQNEILLNINYTLSFCAEMVQYVIRNKNEETLSYRKNIRLLIEHAWEVCQSRGMSRAPLTSLIPPLARMECMIVMNEAVFWGVVNLVVVEALIFGVACLLVGVEYFRESCRELLAPCLE